MTAAQLRWRSAACSPLRQNGVLLRTFTYDSLGRKTQMVDPGLRHLALRLRRRRQPALAGRSARRPARRVLLRRHQPADAPLSVPDDFQHLASCSTPRCAIARGGDLSRTTSAAVANAHRPADARRRRVGLDRDRSTTTRAAASAASRPPDRSRSTASSRAARFRYQYDANDRVTAMTYPDGEIVLHRVRRRRPADRAAQHTAARSTSPTRATISSAGRRDRACQRRRRTRAPTAARRSAIACGARAQRQGRHPTARPAPTAHYSPRGLLAGRGRRPQSLRRALQRRRLQLRRARPPDRLRQRVQPARSQLRLRRMGNLTRNGDR